MEIIDNNIPYDKPISKNWNIFNYELDNFQKYAFDAIDKDKNVLITAHTGSGKTTVAEYAILKNLNTNNRIIYTTPIKALSNQIYKNLSTKYDFDIGIKTGDIDINSEAQVVIMTTEILRNNLFLKENMFTNLACVIFDEVHWIKDKDRGHIWEQSIISLDHNVQLILLSATLPDYKIFGQWVYNIRRRDISIISTNKRIVPLTHYILTKGELIEIMDNNYNINNINLINQDKQTNNYQNNNEIIDKLTKMDLLPALFFCFNRKKCEKYAEQYLNPEFNGIENARYFNFLLAKYKYMTEDGLEQTEQIRKSVINGVAFHHSGLHPILKEVIETMYNKNMINVLFATETFAVGINMPTKTVVFTELEKYTNGEKRNLLKEEYLQMAGRAGRRGIDKKGTIINIINENSDLIKLKSILKSEYNELKSQFKLDINYILKTLNIEYAPFEYYTNSIQHKENLELIKNMQTEYLKLINILTKLKLEIETKKYDIIREYLELKGNKKRKRDLELRRLEKDELEEFNLKMVKYNEYNILLEKKKCLENNITNTENFELENINQILRFLSETNYITNNCLTKKGQIAVLINECDPIVMTEIIYNGMLANLSFAQIATILSIFINEKIIDTKDEYIDDENMVINNPDLELINNKIGLINEIINKNRFLEIDNICKTNMELYIFYLWSSGIEYRNISKYIFFIGDFIKGVLKLCSIFEKLCNIYLEFGSESKLEIYNIIKDYKNKLIRSIITAESLYIHTWTK